MDESVFLICAVVTVSALTSAIAARKGRNPAAWAAISLLISVLAPIILLIYKRGPRPIETYSGAPQAIVAIIAGVFAYQSAIRIVPKSEDLTCKNMMGDVLRISEEGTKSAPGMRVLTITNPVEKSRNSELVECSGSALIGTSATVPISYKAQKTNGQWFIFYSLDK